jgi:hypothetical protein
MTNGIALIDEKKGSRILRQREQPFRSTLDLLRSAPCLDGLTQATLAEAVHAAPLHARMRVPPEHKEWVVKLIGTERASLCSCLGSMTMSKL